MKKQYRIAIIGCGKVAHLHAQAIQTIESAELAAVWSRTPASAEKFAGKYGVRAYSDIPGMVRECHIDLAIVCNPHPFHKDPAIQAAEAGANVLVEKPLASSLADCDAMIRTCRDAGVKLGVVSQRRWYEPVRRVKDAITGGKIGNPVLGTVAILGWRDEAYYNADAWRGTWAMEGGGVLVNQAPHQLDLFQWFMGAIDEVYGIRRNLNHPYIEVEDTALAIVKFKSGAIGNILVSNSQKPGIHGKVQVHGGNGSSVGVQTDGGAMFIAGMSSVLEPPVNDLWTVPGEEHLLKEWVAQDSELFTRIDPAVHYMGCQIRDYLTALDEDHDPAITGVEGRKTVELFTAVYRSTRDNVPVRFPLLPEYDRHDYDGRYEKKM